MSTTFTRCKVSSGYKTSTTRMRDASKSMEFELAAMNDPNHHARETSLLAEPDAFQAYKWYSAALEHGSQQAQARLDGLHEWANKAAEEGNSEAERLLLQWTQ